MTSQVTTKPDRAELRRVAEAATPGKWQWFGNTKMCEVYLATTDRGRRYVMDFVRWGMAGAQPRFQVLIDGKEAGGGVMRTLAELAKGDENAEGRLPVLGPKYEASHRKQFTGIGHADAEWIAAANPTAVLSLLDQLEAVERERDGLRQEAMSNTIEVDGLIYGEHMIRELRDLCARQDKTIVELSGHQARANDVNSLCIRQRDEARAALAASQQETERLRELLGEAVKTGLRAINEATHPTSLREMERIAKEGGVEP